MASTNLRRNGQLSAGDRAPPRINLRLSYYRIEMIR
jgi:hypothetical protein